MAKQLNVNLAFTADTGQAKAQIQDLQNQLSHLSTSVGAGQTLGLTKELNEAATKVAELKGLLASSTTPTGSLDLGKFNESLKKSGMTIKDYAKSLNALGPEGQKAFSQLAQAVTTAEVPMRRANGLLNEMWTTMKNTARWQLTSSMIHGFMGGIQQALGYAKDLNRTLTDIRIVAPEKSMQDMAQFAELANKRAKELSSTTLDYAKGALIYYQQGLDDIQVQERTDVTTKLANVTGDSADEVSSYMTAIWNNFNKAGDESAEHFADILTKLGAETAASTTEITDAIEKYSAVAETIGLSYEAATAAATTLIDRTREAPEVAGTALKTIFARMEGLKQEGSTEEGGTYTSLNKYSEALHNIGVEIKGTNGEMRDADDILDDIGGKWDDLARDQQIALAETVAGVRQWNQFAALMDNYDFFEKYKEMAETDSSGALEEQQKIYEESWQAASNRVKSSIQTIYMQLLDDKFFIELTNKIADLVENFGKLVDGVGGLKTILPAIGTLMLAAFGDKMAKGISNLTYNMKVFGKSGKQEMEQLRKETNEALIRSDFNNGLSGKISKQTLEGQFKLQSLLIENQSNLNEEEKVQFQHILDQNKAIGEQLRLKAQLVEETEEQLQKESGKAGTNYLSQREDETDEEFRDRKVAFNKQATRAFQKQGAANWGYTVIADLEKIKNAYEENEQEIQQLEEKIKTASDEEQAELRETLKLREQIREEIKSTYTDSAKAYNDAKKNDSELDAEFYDFREDVELASKYEDLKYARKKVDEVDDEARHLMSDLGEQADENIKTLKEQQIAYGENKQAAAEAAKGTVEYNEALESSVENGQELINNLQSGSELLMNFAETAMACLMAFEGIKNAVEVFKDPDATFGDQLTAVLTALMMTIPAVVSGIELLNIKNAKAALVAIGTAAGLSAEAKAAHTASAAFKVLGKSMLAFIMSPVGLALIGIAAALTAVYFALKKNYEATHKARNAYADIKEENQELNESLNKTVEAAEGLTDSLKKVKNAAKELKDTELGSSEWTEKLSEANKEAAKLKDEYDELKKSVEKNETTKIRALEDVNEQLREAGLEETKTLDLKEGKDWYRDSTGLRQYTKAGEIKLDTIKSITIHNADVALNANNITEERAKLYADIEKLQQSGATKKEDAVIYGAKDVTSLAHGAYTISNGLTNQVVQPEGGEYNKFDIESLASQLSKIYDFDESKLTDKDWLAANNFDQDFIDALSKSEELQSGIYDVVQQMKGLQEKQVQAYADLLSENQRVKEGIFDKDKSGLAPKQIEEYGSGLVSAMAHDMQVRVDERKGYKESTLIRNQYDNEIDARTAFAEQHGMTYNAEDQTFTKTDANGDTQTDHHSKYTEQYKEWLALAEAEQHATDNLELYKAKLEDSDRDWDAASRISKVFKSQAKDIEKAKDALSDAGDSYDKLASKAKNGNKEASKALSSFDKYCKAIRKDLGELLDLEDSANLDKILDNKFITENSELIEKAIQGDIEAIEELQDKAAEKIILGIETDDTEVTSELGYLQDYIKNTDFDDIEIGASIDDSDFYPVLQSMLASGQITAEQMNDILNTMGYKPKIEYQRVDVTDDMLSEADGGSTATYTYDVPEIDSATGLPTGETHKATAQYETHGKSVSEGGTGKYILVPQIIPEETTFKGANIQKSPSTGGNRRPSNGGGRGGGGGGRRGGGGGGGRRDRVNRPRRQNEHTTVLERYKEITDKIDRNARTSERLSKIQDKLYGKARLNQMDKVNKKHLEEIRLLQKKSKEARQYYLNDRRDAQKALDAVIKASQKAQKKNKYQRLTKEQRKAINGIKDLSFNDYGEITNYTSIMKAFQDQLNAYERVYNQAKNFKNEESQNTYKEKFIDPLKEKIDALKEAMDQYDETRELIEDLKDQIDEAYTSWQEGNYEKLTYTLELNVAINDLDLKKLDYKFSKLQDDVFKAAEAFDLYFTGIGIYSSNMAGKVVDTSKSLEETIKRLQEERELLLQEAKDAKKALEEAKKNYDTKSKKVKGKKEKKTGWYKSYEGYTAANYKNAKKQYEKAKKLNAIGKLGKKKLAKLKALYEKQKKYRDAYDQALKRYKDAIRKGGVTPEQAKAELKKIVASDAQKKKFKNANKVFSNKTSTKKYKQAQKAYKAAITNWKKTGKKKLKGKYYKAAKKAYNQLKKLKENFNVKFNESTFNKAKSDWEKHGKKKSGKYWKAYQKQLKARKQAKKDGKISTTKYSAEYYKAASQNYKNAKAKLKKTKKTDKDAYKKQKAKVKKTKTIFDAQKKLKAQYDLWNEALKNAELAESNIKAYNEALERQKDGLVDLNKQLGQYTILTAVGGKLGQATKAIYDQVEALVKLEESYKNSEIAQSDYVDGLNSGYEEILNQLQALKDLKDEMKGYYGDTISKANEELDKYITKLQYQSTLVSHMQSVAELSGRQFDYDLQRQFLLANTNLSETRRGMYEDRYVLYDEKTKQLKQALEEAQNELALFQDDSAGYIKNQLNTIDAEIAAKETEVAALKEQADKKSELKDAETQLDNLKAKKESLQSGYAETIGEAIKKEIEYYKEAVEASEDAAQEALDNMFGALEEKLENAATLLQNSLDQAAEALEKSLTGIAGGFEEIQRQMGLTSTNQDEYLTKTNQTYELNKMQRTLQKDIDKTNNRQAKLNFQNFAKDLKNLQEKDKLSNLELDIAQKKYDLLKAQIDLEDSRNAKQTIRLSRDNEGNYGYVYVANEDQIEDAEQAVDDATNALYNAQLNAANDYGQKYIQITQQRMQALTDFYNSDEYKKLLSKGDQTAIDNRVDAINKQYKDLMDSYGYLYDYAQNATDYLVDSIQEDSWVYANYNDNIVNISNNLASFNEYSADAARAFQSWQMTVNSVNQIFSSLGISMNDVLSSTEKLTKDVLKDSRETVADIDSVLEQVINKLHDFLDNVLPVLETSIKSFESTADAFAEKIRTAITSDSTSPYSSFNKFFQSRAKDDNYLYAKDSNGWGMYYSVGSNEGATATITEKWKDDAIMAANEKAVKDFYDNGGALQSGFYGFNKDTGIISFITSVKQGSDKYDKWVEDNNILESSITALASGGYTGDWTNNDGKLAFLHEKELVLNAEDTKNILTAVDGIREVAAAGFLSNLHSVSLGNQMQQVQPIEQQVHIEAEFPNVSDRYEIEQAFNNLVNKATQYVSSNRR